MGAEDILAWDAKDLSKAVHRHEVDVAEIVQAYRQQIHRWNDRLVGYIAMAGAQVLEQITPPSQAADEAGSLWGVPVAVKDLFDVQGLITRAGSRFFARSNAADAPSVQVL
ncbi:MAG: amidase family protein, partial [Firmicutes bacterium]|nr:amidase family protein [Bacillota bacterium]